MIKVYFNDIERNICNLIKGADKIYLCSAWFSNTNIAELFHDIEAELIIGQTEFNSKSYLNNLTQCVELYIWKDKDVLMHSKFIVFCKNINDNEHPYAVWTGSYNFTNKAETNIENGMYIIDDNIAKSYMDEWNKIRKLCRHKRCSNK